MQPPYRPPPPTSSPATAGRFLELLDALRHEYEAALHHHHPSPSVDFSQIEPRVQAFLQDTQQMRAALAELEKSSLAKKQQRAEGAESIDDSLVAALGLTFPLPLPNLEAELAALTHALLGGMQPIEAPRTEPVLVQHGPPTIPGTRRSSITAVQRVSRPLEEDSTHGAPHGSTSVASSSHHGSARRDSTGYDWLVVYNPKVPRSIVIDLLHTLPHEGVVCAVRFSPDGSILATGGNRQVFLWSVASGERLGVLQAEDPHQGEGGAGLGDQYVRSLAFSPSGEHLAAGSEDHRLRVWQVGERRLLHSLEAHGQDIYAVDWSPVSAVQVATGSGDRTVRLWDALAGKLLHTLACASPSSNNANIANGSEGKDAGVTSVAFSPDGRYVAAGSLDRLVRLWDAQTGLPVDSLEGHRDSVYALGWGGDGRQLVSGSLDRTVRLWEWNRNPTNGHLSQPNNKACILGHKDFCLSVACSPPSPTSNEPCSRWIISGSKDRSVQFWDTQANAPQLMLQGHKNSVISVACSPVAPLFATGSGDGRARIWSYHPLEATTSPSAGQAAAAAAMAMKSPPDSSQ